MTPTEALQRVELTLKHHVPVVNVIAIHDALAVLRHAVDELQEARGLLAERKLLVKENMKLEEQVKELTLSRDALDRDLHEAEQSEQQAADSYQNLGATMFAENTRLEEQVKELREALTALRDMDIEEIGICAYLCHHIDCNAMRKANAVLAKLAPEERETT